MCQDQKLNENPGDHRLIKELLFGTFLPTPPSKRVQMYLPSAHEALL